MKSNERDEVKPMSVPFFPFSRVAEDQDEMTKVTSDGVNEKEEELARTIINVHRIGCNGTSSTERTLQQQHPMSLPCAREKLEIKSNMKDLKTPTPGEKLVVKPMMILTNTTIDTSTNTIIDTTIDLNANISTTT